MILPKYSEENQELYSTTAGVRSGHSPIDCDCIIEGDSSLPVHVEATHYWVVVIGKDVIVDAHDIALLTGVDEDEVERTLIDQVNDYIQRGKK